MSSERPSVGADTPSGRRWLGTDALPSRALLQRIVLYLTALVLMTFILVPAYLMVAIGFQSPTTVFAGGRVNVVLQEVTLQNFTSLVEDTNMVRYFVNSLVVTAGTTLLSTAIAVSAGYGLTRFEARGKRTVARAILFSYMFSPIVLGIPLYVIFFRLDMLNSYVALVLGLTAIAVPFAVWLMWQYFKTIPIAMEESAWVRGAGRWQTLWYVVLPMARPGYITVAIFSFAVAWNDFTMARVVMTDANMYTINLGASLFLDRVGIGWGERMAMSVLICIPPFLIALFLQNYLLQGFNISDR